jgi:hypothetical protein
MVGDCAGPRWRVLVVNRIEVGGRLFEGLSGICSSCQLFIAPWLEGLTTGTVRPSQLTTCVSDSVFTSGQREERT